MRIRFDEIPPQGLRLQLTDETWFPDADLTRKGGVDVSVLLTRDDQRVLLTGRLQTTVSLVCDRCLEDFELSIDNSFQVDFELVGPEGEEPEAEHACSQEEMDTILLAAPVIDLSQILEQQVFLALPQKRLCRDDCAGICSRCGANRNHEKCRCPADEDASPFSVLASLKKP